MAEEHDQGVHLHAYLDGELPEQEARALEERLAREGALRRALEMERAFRERFRARMRRVHAPPALRADVERLLQKEKRRSTSRLLSWWESILAWLRTSQPMPRWALVLYTALIVFLIGGTSWLIQQRPTPPSDVPHTVFRKLAGKHNVYVYPTPLVDITGTPAEVAAWFHNRTGRAVSVPQLPEWTLVGGRVGEFHHQPTLHLIYRQGAQYLSVIVFAPRDEDFPPSSRRIVSGREVYVGTAWEQPVILWLEGDNGYALIGERGQSLEALLDLLLAP